MLKVRHAAQYKDLLRLLVKHGLGPLNDSARAELDEGDLEGAGTGRADELADDLEALGPVFVKLGQLLSTRPDLVPPEYAEALSRLRDDVATVEFEAIREVIEEELGARASKAFLRLDEKPLACASLGQVHRAELRDGRRVAVKVRRPGIEEQVRRDVSALTEIADLLERHTKAGRRHQLGRVARELGETLAEELDYRRELRNLVRLREDLAAFRDIVVPAPIEDYCSRRVLVMEYVPSVAVTDLSPVVRAELDGAALAEQLFEAYLQQILVNGFFHADPHPGNVHLGRDRKLVLLDCGMMGRIGEDLRAELLKLVLALSEARGHEAAEIALDLGRRAEDAQPHEFETAVVGLVARESDARLASLQTGRIILEICRAAGRAGILLPPELTLLGKTLLNLDEVGRALDPEFDPNAAIRRHSSDLMSRTVWKDAAPSHLMRTLLESKELVERAPRRLNRILELAASNELRLRVDSNDSRDLLDGLQKISNRVTTGILLGSVVIGAALLAHVETPHRLLGYPAIAILFFLAAAIGSLVLLANAIFRDKSC